MQDTASHEAMFIQQLTSGLIMHSLHRSMPDYFQMIAVVCVQGCLFRIGC